MMACRVENMSHRGFETTWLQTYTVLYHYSKYLDESRILMHRYASDEHWFSSNTRLITNEGGKDFGGEILWVVHNPVVYLSLNNLQEEGNDNFSWTIYENM